MTLALLAQNAALVLGLMTALWVVSVVRRDASIVDPWWSMAFLLVTGLTAGSTGLTPAKTLLLLMVAVWAIRLWLHLLLRSRGKPEDPRYAAFRQRYGPVVIGGSASSRSSCCRAVWSCSFRRHSSSPQPRALPTPSP